MPQLYFPRDDVSLRRYGGILVALEPLPEILQHPLKIYKSGDIAGKASGYRSALVEAEGRVYRIKGARPHRRPRHEGLPDPLGGQYLTRVLMEIENMHHISEIFEKEGIPYPCRPVGYYEYPLEFHGDKLGASIFEVQGDTRLDEFVAWLEEGMPVKDVTDSEPFYIFTILGMKVGKLKRIMDDNGYLWNEPNAHLGNFVVFERGGYIHLGAVDLDSMIRLGQEEGVGLRLREYQSLFRDIRRMVVSSRNRHGIRLSRRRIGPFEFPTVLRDALEMGFREGYATAKDNLLSEDMVIKFKKTTDSLEGKLA